jgi:hypothetical protein
VKRFICPGLLLFFLLPLPSAVPLCAQQLATLNVTVTDQSNAGIPRAQVTLKNTATGVKRSDISDAAGLAVLPGLSAGNYELTVEAAQFSASRSTLTLTVGQTASLPVILGVTAVKEQVEVRETAQ